MSTVHERLGPDFPGDHTFILFKNMNGTCFVNSVLQGLYSVPSVRDFIWAWDRALGKSDLREQAENVPTKPFGHFLKIYVDSMNAPQNEVWYEPTYFLDRVFENGDSYHRGGQYDAYEFLRFLIWSIQTSVETFRDLLGRRDLPEFRPLFEFYVTTSLYRERMISITVTDSPTKRLQDSIATWMCEETDFGYVTRELQNVPPVLTVHFNVVGVDQETRDSVKRFNQMQIPDTLILRPKPGETVVYELCSAVAHNGKTITTGHYLAIIKARDRWVVADDENLFGLNEEQTHDFLMKQWLPGYDSVAVTILFYQKVNE